MVTSVVEAPWLNRHGINRWGLSTAYDELRRRRDLLDLAEQPLELEVVAQVAVADDPQFATFALAPT
jgi:hypothetical protein